MATTTIPSALGSFAVVAGLVTLIPGLDTALVLRSALVQGRRHAFATALGITTGALIWGAAAAVGISALLTTSRDAFTAVRIAGAAYMILLGGSMLRASFKRRGENHGDDADPLPSDSVEQPTAPGPAGRPGPGSAVSCWLRGATTNLLNPKVGVFYVAMLPQFIPRHTSHLLMGVLLAGVHDVECLIWFSVLIIASGFARAWLHGGRAQRALDRITGSVLIGFGLELVLSEH